jgi:Ca2+-transporting ATPase
LLAIRSERDPIWVGFFSNPALLGAVALTVVLQLCVLYVPVLNGVFGTQPLNGTELAWCAAFSSVGLIAVEVEKLLIRRGVILRAPAASAAA